MEEKDILQPEVAEQVEKQPELEVVAQVDGEVASFDQQPADVEPAPPVEVPVADIEKDVQTVSADEQKSIDAAQKKAQREYQVAFGDRQIRKPSKFISVTIAVVIIALLAFFVTTKIPMFYNCMVPASAKAVETLFEETNIKDAEAGEQLWAVWYEYDADEAKREFKLMPGNTYNSQNPQKPSENVFADLDETAMDMADSFAQQNWLICNKKTNSAVDMEGVKYVTVIWYEFESVEDSKTYAEIQKAKYNGQYEHKNALFYQLGMVKGNGQGFVYDAWYNGGKFVEVYATDAAFAELVRNEINYAA